MMQMASRAIRGARQQWRRLGRDDKGSAMAFLAVLPILAGAVAIGVETGQLYRLKRQMQGSADAAALSGAVDRMAGKTNTVITATARYEAQRNGFTNGSNNVTVTVNAPPTSGPNVSTTGAVEVIITKSTTFSLGAVLVNWLGGTNGRFNVTARSVAAQNSTSTSTTSYEACLVALTTANEQGVSFSSFDTYDSDCTIASNGGATGSGSSASINIASYNNASLYTAWTRGSLSVSDFNHIRYTKTPSTNQTGYIVDPYASLPTPTPGSCTYTNFTVGKGSSVTLNPGTYCGGINIDNSPNNVDMAPGTYYIANGDFYIASVNNVGCSACVDGTSGVTIVLTQTTGNNADIGGFYVSSDNNVTLSAPPSGTYKGVLAYQDRRASVGTMTSTSKVFSVISLNNARLSGAIYFPNNRIDISNINNFGGNSSNGCTIWVGRYIKFSSFNNNYKGGCATFGTTPVGVTTTTTVTKGKVFE
jgi:Flp pilus assembly protein TadG